MINIRKNIFPLGKIWSDWKILNWKSINQSINQSINLTKLNRKNKNFYPGMHSDPYHSHSTMQLSLVFWSSSLESIKGMNAEKLGKYWSKHGSIALGKNQFSGRILSPGGSGGVWESNYEVQNQTTILIWVQLWDPKSNLNSVFSMYIVFSYPLCNGTMELLDPNISAWVRTLAHWNMYTVHNIVSKTPTRISCRAKDTLKCILNALKGLFPDSFLCRKWIST